MSNTASVELLSGPLATLEVALSREIDGVKSFTINIFESYESLIDLLVGNSFVASMKTYPRTKFSVIFKNKGPGNRFLICTEDIDTVFSIDEESPRFMQDLLGLLILCNSEKISDLTAEALIREKEKQFLEKRLNEL